VAARPQNEEVRNMTQKPSFAVSLLLLFLAVPSHARITRLDIQRTSEASGDGYVTITGRAFGEVDPAHPLNSIIQDLQLAPRNERGMVEYSMDFTILKPPDSGNGLLFYEVVNRGRATTAATGIEALGRKRGYTMVWSGWQGDVAKSNPAMLTISVPI